MKILEFQIMLHSDRRVFYPNEQLTGQVVLNLSEPMRMQNLEIKMKGEAKCSWYESRTKRGEDGGSETVRLKGKDELLNFKQVLFGSGGSTEFIHPAGYHLYPFGFNMPPVLPSSFEGDTGHIRYHIKVSIERPWKYDHKIKRPIIINEVIDINQEHFLNGPGGEKVKEVGCLCCASGKLVMHASLDRAGYCPGENALLTGTMENQTTRDMPEVKVKLKQETVYHGKLDGDPDVNGPRHDTKRHETTISRFDGQPLPQGETINWSNQLFFIPAIPPTISTKVLTNSYWFEIQIDVPWGLDPCIKLPITMGTVPFRATYGMPGHNYGMVDNQFLFPENQGFAQPPLPQMPPPPPQLLGYPDMPPPTYMAAVGQNEVNIAAKDEKVNFGNQTYMPVYTYAQPTAPVIQ